MQARRHAAAVALGALVGVLLVGAPARADGGADTPAARDPIGAKIDAVRGARELWQEIPWQSDLGAARRLARATGKPIFAWAMNGNPLGCT